MTPQPLAPRRRGLIEVEVGPNSATRQWQQRRAWETPRTIAQRLIVQCQGNRVEAVTLAAARMRVHAPVRVTTQVLAHHWLQKSARTHEATRSQESYCKWREVCVVLLGWLSVKDRQALGLKPR